MGAQLNSRAERQLAQALAVLGLQPGASSKDVEAAYFMRRSTLARQENAEHELQRLEKAIRFIKVTDRFGDRNRTPRTTAVREGDQLGRALRLLGLSEGASAEEVDAAMAAVRETVSDRERLREFQRAVYVVKTRGRLKKKRVKLRRVSRSLVIASVALVVLTIVSGFQLATRFRHHIVRFEVGDAVYRLDDGTRFGVILGFEEGHEFPNGAQRDAYNIRLYPDDQDAWISAYTARSALTTSR
jgi:hypothetical protein